MNRFFCLFIVSLLLAITSFANIPTRPAFIYQQADGSEISVISISKESLIYYLTQDGKVLFYNSQNNSLCYAISSDDGFKSSLVVAHSVNNRNKEEQHFVAKSALSEDALSNQILPKRIEKKTFATVNSNGLGTYGVSGKGAVKSIGSPKIPIIMVEFADTKFQSTTTKEKLTRFFNEPGYKDEKYCKGSVRDYFISQSKGLFTPNYVIVAKVEVGAGYAHYGADENGHRDTRCLEFVQEVLEKANAAGVDFSQFLVDGKIPLVGIFFAGMGEHNTERISGSQDYLWPHFRSLDAQEVKINGYKVGSYYVGNETNPQFVSKVYSGKQVFAGMGIMVHEFGHALGLPDFYNTRGKIVDEKGDTIKNMDYWSVMDYGQYAYNGYRPIGYNAYERSVLGWQRVVDLKDSLQYKLYSFANESADSVSCYRIVNPVNDKEYFLLENRQVDTWYPSFMGTGLLITHVDYNQSAWVANILNNITDHPRFTYVPADGNKAGVYLASWAGYQNDLFPGTTNSSEFFTDNLLYSRWASAYIGRFKTHLYNIAVNNGLVSFDYGKVQTGIASTEVFQTNLEGVYDLQGRKVQHPVHGLYIQNGRKVFIK